MDQNLHYLNILIELSLYPKIKVLSEGTEIKDINAKRRELIEDFWKDLPEAYRVENYKQITLDKLSKMLEQDKKRNQEQER